MSHYQHEVLVRKFGAEALEQRLTDVALLMRSVFPQCSWHLDEDPDKPAQQRLDVEFADARTSLYFTNDELRSYSSEKRHCDTDHRLQHALHYLFRN
jgi:hypothetical protein